MLVVVDNGSAGIDLCVPTFIVFNGFETQYSAGVVMWALEYVMVVSRHYLDLE